MTIDSDGQARRLGGGLAVDGEGRFLHRGEPVTHRRLLSALWGSLVRGRDGRWRVRLGREEAPVDVDGSPWVVTGAERVETPRPVVRVHLAGGARGLLDPASLRVGPDGHLAGRLASGAEVVCARAGQLALGALLEADPAGTGDLLLRLGTRRHRVVHAPGSPRRYPRGASPEAP